MSITAQVWEVAQGEYLLLTVVHHSMIDGWSIRNFSRDLTAAYAAELSGSAHVLPPPLVAYSDYAAWQRRTLDATALEVRI